MYQRLHLRPQRHSGRLLPHRHTSYGSVLLLMLMLGALLVGASFSAIAAGDPPPQSGYIGITGEMPGTPPKTAATIIKPSSGLNTATSPVTVSGTCPINTVVEIYKNNIFAGSAACTASGTYSLDIDLLYGANTLVARVYDALDQAGPDSNQVQVYYSAIPPQTDPLTSLSFASTQLLIETTAVYRGVFPELPLGLPLQVIGGTPPFAVNILWGDNTNTLVTRGDNLTFTVNHSYQKAGTFPVTIEATDSQQRVAFLTIAVIVNGTGDTIAGSAAAPAKTVTITERLLLVWPLYLIILVAIVSFYLGERREKHVLEAVTI